MLHADAPPIVSAWATNLPPWLQVRTPTSRITILDLGVSESEAISLTMELKADFLLVDDLAARNAAIDRGLKVAGTIGLIADAHRRGWLNFDQTVLKLLAINYRIGQSVIDEVRRGLE